MATAGKSAHEEPADNVSVYSPARLADIVVSSSEKLSSCTPLVVVEVAEWDLTTGTYPSFDARSVTVSVNVPGNT
jgi:hypothetical protein